MDFPYPLSTWGWQNHWQNYQNSINCTVMNLPSSSKIQQGTHHERGSMGSARHTEALFQLTLDKLITKRFLFSSRHHGHSQKSKQWYSDCNSANVKGASGQSLTPSKAYQTIWKDVMDPPTSQMLFMLSVEIEMMLKLQWTGFRMPSQLSEHLSAEHLRLAKGLIIHLLSHHLRPVLALSRQDSHFNNNYSNK